MPAKNFHDLIGEAFRRPRRIGVEREGGAAIRPWRTANAQIHPARRNRFQHAELLGHFQRAVMRQHDTGRTDTNPAGGGANGGQQDFRRATGMGCAIVMFGAPVAVEAQSLHMTGEGQGFLHGGCRAAARGDRGLIKHGKDEAGHGI